MDTYDYDRDPEQRQQKAAHARAAAQHLWRRLLLHGSANTFVSTRIRSGDLRALLDHYDALRSRS